MIRKNKKSLFTEYFKGIEEKKQTQLNIRVQNESYFERFKAKSGKKKFEKKKKKLKIFQTVDFTKIAKSTKNRPVSSFDQRQNKTTGFQGFGPKKLIFDFAR